MIRPIIFVTAACLWCGVNSQAAVSVQNLHTYSEMCDASAAVALDDKHFVAADDEGNTLRVYERGVAKPIRQYDLSRFLIGHKKGKETDLEAGARVGDTIYWISSHGRNREGDEAPNRHRFFAQRILGGGVMLDPIGKTYNNLVADILADKRFNKYNFSEASTLPPKKKDGLNIEGLCARPDGSLLIGFRNPQHKRRALLLPLLNPDKVIEGERGRFGKMIELDLGGRGIRDICFVDGRYWIIAGKHDNDTGKDFQIFQWDGEKEPKEIPDLHFGDLNPEALFRFPNDPPGQFQVLSDDGGEIVGGVACKELPPAKRRFRAGEIILPP